FNVDGHERFKAFNRPNQRGPKEMGWRTTAQNFNLNRDYAKVDSPEMAAMLAMVNAWDPLFYIDLHVTDGAKFQHDISVQIEPVYSGPPELRAISRQYQDAVLADLNRKGSMALPYYPSFIEYDNPASGFADSVSPPRYSTGYYQLRNRFGVLVETHSWKTYPVRVKATAETIRATLAQVAAHGDAWQAAAYAADRQSAQLAGTPVALTYQTGKTPTLVDFKGYRYTRTPSEVSGTLMTRYDESAPEVWKLPLYKDISVGIQVAAPKAGYIVPPAFAALIENKLRAHGIVSHRTGAKQANQAIEQFHADSATLAAQSFESHQGLTVTGAWRKDIADIPAGSLFVPIAQPKAKLVMALLEPQAPDSYLAWGLFNNQFEQKEYMEGYVAEEVARGMLKDPAIKAEFEAKLAADKAFAASPQQRLEFFARKHPSWDERYQVYPVMRTDAAFNGD
ncbi:MAG: peptidase M14, partial [Arenimonas sp.]|nr:peptidase M14 [Arenimonas sp.]